MSLLRRPECGVAFTGCLKADMGAAGEAIWLSTAVGSSSSSESASRLIIIAPLGIADGRLGLDKVRSIGASLELPKCVDMLGSHLMCSGAAEQSRTNRVRRVGAE
jgi:hypothetical protein